MAIGARIRQLRTARGYSLDELVERMEGVVSKQALSKYEHDKAMPRPTVLVALAKALDVKAARLIAEPRFGFEEVVYRELARLPKREQEALENRVKLELESRLQLMDRLGIEPRFPLTPTTSVKDASDAECVADELRARWSLGSGPIPSMVDALEGQGVHLIDVETDRKFDGLAVFATNELGERVACGAATRAQTSRARQRMSYAHEVGHLAVEVENPVDAEPAAARFAGAFLFPGSAVRAEFGSHRTRITTNELLIAKRRWGVSIQGVLRRLRDLEILDEAEYRWWCMRINQVGWRATEPGDEPAEVSTWKESFAHRAAAEGLIAQEALAEYVPKTGNRTVTDGIDRRALLKLPLEDRRSTLRAHAESVADEYNAALDTEWLDADLSDE